MPANNTPIPDLVELSGIGEFRTYTATPGGGGDILGVVDNATYSDSESGNSSTQITQLNDWNDADSGWLMIDGVEYGIELADPDNTPVTITTLNPDGTHSSFDVSGDSGSSNVVFIQAIPTGGGASRYFMLLDDDVGDVGPITSIQTRSIDFSPAGDDVIIDADQNNNVQAVCFRAGTLIATSKGLRAVEEIAAGDSVMTMDHGYQRVIWTGGLHVSAHDMARQKMLRPIRIEANTFGPGLPDRALEVSPQHRVLLRSIIARRMFDSSEILVPAVKLLGVPGVSRLSPTDTHYVHLLLDNHEVLFANGMPAESLYLGQQTRFAFEDRPLFKEAADRSGTAKAARKLVQRDGDVDEFLRRIAKNEKQLLDSAP